VFHEHSRFEDYYFVGGKGKMSCLGGFNENRFDRFTVGCLVDTPCRWIIEDLRNNFEWAYGDGLLPPSGCYCPPEKLAKIKASIEENPDVVEAREKLRSSEWMLSVINEHLASLKWTVDDDGSILNVVRRSPSPSPAADENENSKKRKASGGVEEEEDLNHKRQKKSHESESGASRGSQSKHSDGKTKTAKDAPSPQRRSHGGPSASGDSDKTLYSTRGALVPRVARAGLRFAGR
jgi:hypothetical protein